MSDLEEMDFSSELSNDDEIFDEKPGKSKKPKVYFEVESDAKTGEIINKLLKDEISVSQAAELFERESDSEDENEKQSFEDKIVDHSPKKRRKRRCRKKLPPNASALIGEAHTQYAYGNMEKAEAYLLETIRIHPHCPDTYEALYNISKNKDPEIAAKYALLAAHLSDKAEFWEKMALNSSSIDQKQAIFYYSRAIQSNPRNAKYHWARIKVIEGLGDNRKLLRAYMKMLKHIFCDKEDEYLKLAIEIARLHYDNDDYKLSQDTLENAFKKYPNAVTADAANNLLEVLIQLKDYLKGIQILMDYMHVELLFDKPQKEKNLTIKEKISNAYGCKLPDDFPTDLKANMAICMINLKNLQIAKTLVDYVKEMNVKEFSDLYLELAETYSANGIYNEAVDLLEPIIDAGQEVIEVWVLYADCLRSCNNNDQAVDAYSKVLKTCSQRIGEDIEATESAKLLSLMEKCRLSLSEILKTLGKTSSALSVLCESSGDKYSSLVLYEKCKMLREQNNDADYIKTAILFFRRHFWKVREPCEADILINTKKIKSKMESLKERCSNTEALVNDKITFIGDDVCVEDQWRLFLDVCNLMYSKKQYKELEKLLLSGLGSTVFIPDTEKAKEIEFMFLIACLATCNFNHAYNVARDIVNKYPNHTRSWNILCHIISKADDLRHNRFLMRLTGRLRDSIPLGILNGHNCVAAGTYRYALAEYTQVFKRDIPEPIVPLMLGLTYIHMACQKFVGNKNDLTLQGSFFLDYYLKMRGECQESYYNMGRAFHQLKLLTYAIHYYEKALKIPPTRCSNGKVYDLTMEIIFNLSLCYKNSNPKWLKYYQLKYIKV